MQFKLIFFLLLASCWSHSQLIEIKSFGKNQGNLNMWIFVPDSHRGTKEHSLVVAMHGCSQTAEAFSYETGWIELAEKNDFIVLFPEQKSSNNITKCFNWFRENDVSRSGESASIFEMIQYVQANYKIDSSRIFAYGISAGGAMSSALMAQYPETFNTGAVLAGGGFGLCKNAIDGYRLMQRGADCCTTNAEYADFIIKYNKPTTNYPKLIVLYGTEDKTVNPINSLQLIQQWKGIFELKQNVIHETTFPQFENKHVTKTEYKNETNSVLITEYKIEKLAHLLPVNPGDGAKMGGKIGNYTIDFDFYSTYYIATDFGIIKNP